MDCRLGRGTWIALACVLAATSHTARADVHRLGVAPTGDELASALSTALAPWDVEIVAVDATPADIAQAETLARAREVDAVVWVEVDETGAGATLWVYDAADSNVLGTRAVSAPPFDAPTAAALSLSVKTLLRHSLVAPEKERFGVVTAPPPPPPPPPPVHHREPRLLLAAGGGVRMYDDDGLEVGPRLGLQVVWYPGGGWLGVVAALEAGPDRSVAGEDFVGNYRDNAFSLGVRAAGSVSSRLVLHAQLAGAVRASGIDGVVVSLAQRAMDHRYNPSIGGELGLRARLLADLHLEAGAGLEATVRRQRYTVFEDPVVTVPRVAVSARIALAVPFM